MKLLMIVPTSIAVVALLSILTAAPGDDNNAGTGIIFQPGSWSEVLAQAKTENKLVFLDIYASWCGPCKLLKSRTFPDQEVGAFFNSNFINYAIDAEKGEGIYLAKKYQVTGYPTLLFVDGKGTIVVKTMGYHSSKQLINVGKEVVRQNEAR